MSSNATTEHVLVTGGAGFIGSHLVDALIQDGNTVTILDDLSTGDLSNLAHARHHDALRLVEGDVRDEELVQELVASSSVVFHLAATVGVQRIVDDPLETLSTNIRGSETVLAAAAEHGARCVVASTSEVYGKGVEIPFSEDDDVLLGPTTAARWGYAASKMIDEFQALAHHREDGLEVSIARLFNTVGPRQAAEYGMVIPRFVRQALEGEPLTVYGDGSQARCFCDVADVVQVIQALADEDAAIGQVFNIGSDHEVSILELAKLVIETVAQEIDQEIEHEERIRFLSFEEVYGPDFEEPERRVPDLSRIEETLGWTPETPLRETIRRVIDYEQEVQAGVTI